MTLLDQVNEKLCAARNAAILKHGNGLLASGINIDSEQFRTSMLEYAGTLEEWRYTSLKTIAAKLGLVVLDANNGRIQ
jgi:hypothetical protein